MNDSRASRPTFFDSAACLDFCRQNCVEPDRLRRARYALLRMSESVESSLDRLGQRTSQSVLEYFDFEPLRRLESRVSQLDGSTKFLFEARDGVRLETVLLRAKTARTTVCVSSQVGCQAGCPFCATGRMGLVRNLEPPEILEQVRVASAVARSENRRVRNVVFMGMGEPLHNEEHLHAAIDLLTSDLGFAFPQHRILVSTVGVPDGMLRLVDRFPGIQLALSLHASNPEQRARLVPWSRHNSWDELWDVIRTVSNIQHAYRSSASLMIEYIMIRGLNDSPGDAEALAKLLAGLHTIVNLIPYNPIPFVKSWQPTTRQCRDVFAKILREARIFTTIRYSMGSDVQAACGQLVQANRNWHAVDVQRNQSRGLD